MMAMAQCARATFVVEGECVLTLFLGDEAVNHSSDVLTEALRMVGQPDSNETLQLSWNDSLGYMRDWMRENRLRYLSSRFDLPTRPAVLVSIYGFMGAEIVKYVVGKFGYPAFVKKL